MRIVVRTLLVVLALLALLLGGLWAFADGLVRAGLDHSLRAAGFAEVTVGPVETRWLDGRLTVDGLEMDGQSLGAVEARLRPAALWSGRLVVDDLVLREAELTLREDERGRWFVGGAALPTAASFRQGRLSLARVRLEDGRLRLQAAGAGTALELGVARLRVDALESALAGRPTGLRFAGRIGEAEVDFDGDWQFGERALVDGRLEARGWQALVADRLPAGRSVSGSDWSLDGQVTGAVGERRTALRFRGRIGGQSLALDRPTGAATRLDDWQWEGELEAGALQGTWRSLDSRGVLTAERLRVEHEDLAFTQAGLLWQGTLVAGPEAPLAVHGSAEGGAGQLVLGERVARARATEFNGVAGEQGRLRIQMAGLTGLVVEGPEGAEALASRALEADQLVLVPGDARLVLDEVRLEGARMRFARTAGGRWQGLPVLLAGEDDWRVEVARLSAGGDSRLALEDAAVEPAVALAVKPAQLGVVRQATAERPWRIRLEGALAGGGRVEGEADLERLDIAAAGRIAGRLRAVPARGLAGYLAGLPGTRPAAGAVDLDFSLVARGETLSGGAHVMLQGLRLAEGDGGGPDWNAGLALLEDRAGELGLNLRVRHGGGGAGGLAESVAATLERGILDNLVREYGDFGLDAPRELLARRPVALPLGTLRAGGEGLSAISRSLLGSAAGRLAAHPATRLAVCQGTAEGAVAAARVREHLAEELGVARDRLAGCGPQRAGAEQTRVWLQPRD